MPALTRGVAAPAGPCQPAGGWRGAGAAVSLAIWLLVWASLLLALERVVRARLQCVGTKLLFLPGAMLVALAKALACVLGGTPLHAIHLWRRGPLVEHAPPRLWGAIVLGLLPLGAVAAAVLGLHAALAPPLRLEIELPPLEPSLSELDVLLGASAELLAAAWQALCTAPAPLEPRLWAFAYFVAGLLLYGAPDVGQWRVLASVLSLGYLVLAALDYLGVGARFLSRGWLLQWSYGDAVWERLGLLVLAALVLLVVAVGLMVLSRFVRALLWPRAQR
ncbi:MAG: hypothetical protein KatS3mg102_0765 [Planctomycetota bacterium]|nr:MAG: hypothetical protein KatS3mg102_0765 [Planctomycetota bacterium]